MATFREIYLNHMQFADRMHLYYIEVADMGIADEDRSTWESSVRYIYNITPSIWEGFRICLCHT